MSETLGPDITTTPPPLPAAAPGGTGATAAESAPARLQCDNCGGAVIFTPGTTAVTCIQCASQFPIAAGQGGEEHDLEAGLNDPRASEGGDPTAPAGTGELSQELVCPSCGGAVGFVGTLTATRCPFCARPVTSDDIHTAPNRFPVDGIVPFGLDAASAEKDVRAWMSKRKWAPRAFKKYTSTGSFTGVYLPFFTFDADTDSEYRGRRGTYETRTVTDKDGRSHDEEYTSWDPWKDGRLETKLDDVPVAAESSLDRDRMRDLEPWPTESAIAFRPEYLAGFLARRYDRSLAACVDEVRPRMDQLVVEAIEWKIGGDDQEIENRNTTWSNQTFRHLLLPVYLLVVAFKGKPYQIAVNGVTGEVHGKRPYSWAKIASTVLAVLLALTAIGIYTWQLEPATTTDSSTSAPAAPSLSLEERLAQARAEAEAREAARVYTPNDCRIEITSYRRSTPDTFFPAAVACDRLPADQRLAVARGVFEGEQINAALDLVLALNKQPDASPRERCRARLTLAAARVAAKQDDLGEQDAVGLACAGIPAATVERMTDDVADEYLARRKAALADAH